MAHTMAWLTKLRGRPQVTAEGAAVDAAAEGVEPDGVSAASVASAHPASVAQLREVSVAGESLFLEGLAESDTCVGSLLSAGTTIRRMPLDHDGGVPAAVSGSAPKRRRLEFVLDLDVADDQATPSFSSASGSGGSRRGDGAVRPVGAFVDGASHAPLQAASPLPSLATAERSVRVGSTVAAMTAACVASARAGVQAAAASAAAAAGASAAFAQATVGRASTSAPSAVASGAVASVAASIWQQRRPMPASFGSVATGGVALVVAEDESVVLNQRSTAHRQAALARQGHPWEADRGESRFAQLADQDTHGWHYTIQLCVRGGSCHGCSRHIEEGQLEVAVCRLGTQGHRPWQAHVGCLPLIPGLARPCTDGSWRTPSLLCGPGVTDDDRMAAAAQMQELPPPPPRRQLDCGMASLLPPEYRAAFLLGGPSSGSIGGGGGAEDAAVAAAIAAASERSWRPRSSGRGEGLRRLMQTEGDFSPEDYETLLELDRGGEAGAEEEEAVLRRSLIQCLPVAIVRRGDKVEQCMVCLEDMGPRAKVKILPCMHRFHTKCIDRWLRQRGRQPRCPVDQTLVTLAGHSEPTAATASSAVAYGGPVTLEDGDEGVVCIS